MLVILVVLTALGLSVLSVMELTTLDEKQAGNEQQQMRVEQVAVSEVLSQLRTLRPNTSYLDGISSFQTTLTPIYNTDDCTTVDPDEVCQTVTLVYLGIGPAPSGFDPALYEGMLFRIDSDALNPATGALSTHNISLTHARLIPPPLPPPPPPPPPKKLRIEVPGFSDDRIDVTISYRVGNKWRNKKWKRVKKGSTRQWTYPGGTASIWVKAKSCYDKIWGECRWIHIDDTWVYSGASKCFRIWTDSSFWKTRIFSDDLDCW